MRALLIRPFIVLLMLLAGPYRAVAFESRASDGIGQSLATWAGILLGFPLCAALGGATVGEVLYPWLALMACGWVQMFARWRGAPLRDPCRPHCWLGRAEPLLALLLATLTAAACGPGAYWFFLSGYLCSTAEWLLRRLQRRLDAGPPPRAARERLLALSRWLAWASPIAGRFALARVLLAWSFAGGALRAAWLFWRGRARAAGPAAAARPTFMGRVGSIVVGHLILSAIGGTVFIKLFGLILAIPLWCIGWKVEAPEPVKREGRAFMARMHDAFEDKKQEAGEQWDRLKDRTSERLDHAREAAGEQWRRGKQEASEAVQGAKRNIFWRAVTGW